MQKIIIWLKNGKRIQIKFKTIESKNDYAK